jgi:exosortase A
MSNITHSSVAAEAGVASRTMLGFVMPLAAILLAVIFLYRNTAASMLSFWMKYDTYQYGLLVLPVFFWLLWRLRSPLLAAPWQPAWWAVGLASASGVLWLVGEFAEANFLQHFAVVSMFVFSLVAVFGRQRARLAAFPLAFLIFAVPFGEGAVPTLMDWTADATVAALRISGIPVYREGLWFVLPSGTWSVIEACSGVKYLLTSVVVGSLFAYLLYRSKTRRVLFLVAAVVVALFANWLRAYLLVLGGHLTDNQFMNGQDHMIFGWIVFAVAIAGLFGIGARYAEPSATMASIGAESAALASPLLAAAIALCAVSFWPWLASYIEGKGPVSSTTAQFPVVATGGWVEVEGRDSDWKPSLVGPRSLTTQRFRNGTTEVQLHVAMFENQYKGAELASSVNRIVRDSDPVWRLTSMTEFPIKANALPPRVLSARIQAGDRSYVIWHWMISAGQPTLSRLKGKANVVRARVLGTSDRAFWVALLIPFDDARPEDADASARQFVADMGSSLSRTLQDSAR